MDVLLDLLVRFGLPTTLLLLLAWYHVRVVRSKDEEIRRVNEARVAESQASSERMMGVATEFTRLATEGNATLELLAERLRSARPQGR